MKSGDYIRTENAVWTVAFVGDVHQMCSAMRPGRYAFVCRALPNDYFDDVAYSHVHEDDVYQGWQQGPEFVPGQLVTFEDEHFTVHKVTEHQVALRRADGTFATCWKWQLALLAERAKRLSFEHADWVEIPAEAV